MYPICIGRYKINLLMYVLRTYLQQKMKIQIYDQKIVITFLSCLQQNVMNAIFFLGYFIVRDIDFSQTCLSIFPFVTNHSNHILQNTGMIFLLVKNRCISARI